MEKVVWPLRSTSLSSRILVSVGKNSRLWFSQDKNLHNRNGSSIGKSPINSWSWQRCVLTYSTALMKLNLQELRAIQVQARNKWGWRKQTFFKKFLRIAHVFKKQLQFWVCSSKGVNLILPVSHSLQCSVNCLLLLIWHKLILQLWLKLDLSSDFQDTSGPVHWADFCQLKINTSN